MTGFDSAELARLAEAPRQCADEGSKASADDDLSYYVSEHRDAIVAAVSRAETATPLIAYLAQYMDKWRDAEGMCELTAVDGFGRCRSSTTAVRWEDGFADAVCEHHATTARERGVMVVALKADQ